MLKFISSIFLLLATFSATAATNVHHLSFANGKIQALVSWNVEPQVERESNMVVEFKTNGGVIPADLKAILFMPDMGHGSSPTRVEKISESSFKVSKMYFTMPGVWEIRLTIKDENGAKETKFFTVQL